MNIHGKYIAPVGVPSPQFTNFEKIGNKKTKKSSFNNHFQHALQKEDLKISKHARHRLEERQININESQWKKITKQVNEAKKMGVNESLVLIDQAALIVSAKNKTVITAMDRKEASSQIFTNINGTIIID